jgi:hypothetical protein
MRILSSNQRLTILALIVVVVCFAYFLFAENSRTERSKQEFAQLQPESIIAIRFGKSSILKRDDINAIVAAIQRSHWTTFEKKYSTERQRMILVREGTPSYIVDLRQLGEGSDLVQVVRFNSSNQSETLLLSGENREIRPLLRKFSQPSFDRD